MNVGVRQPYIRIVGISVDTSGRGHNRTPNLTPVEEDEFRHMASNPQVYDLIARSIAPSIYGSEDMKKAIACLLFGGSRKKFVFVLVFDPVRSKINVNRVFLHPCNLRFTECLTAWRGVETSMCCCSETRVPPRVNCSNLSNSVHPSL